MSKPNQSGEARLKETILVVDDDEAIRRGLFWTLNSDYHVLQAACRTDAFKLLQQETIDVVVSDLHLPPRLGGFAHHHAAHEPDESQDEHHPEDPAREAREIATQGALCDHARPLLDDTLGH